MIYTDISIANSKLPLLAFAIHNGHFLPLEILRGCGVDEATRLREEDPFTDGFAKCFSNNVVVQTSRFAVDLNRSPEKTVYQKPEDAWGLKVRKNPLPQKLYETLIKAYETFYRTAFYQIDRLLQYHEKLIILDLHSYNHHRKGPSAILDPQNENPDIILGRNNLPESEYPAIEKLRLLLQGRPFLNTKLDCRCDVKFSGGYFSQWVNYYYGKNVLCLAVEFKKIFMDEWSGELHLPAYLQLQDIFQTAVFQWMEDLPK
ncbi:MAG: N-formylglutamate amidohydrolase [Candidatus Cloacimonas sp.]